MRQRVMIAMAIANDPDVIIADEPTTALDVTIQAQVLEVLKTAQHETGAAVIMITHDLGVVAGIADRVQVMYAGRAVETGTVDDIYYRPRMPYTIGLLGSVPRVDEREKSALAPVEGNPPSLLDLPPGCPFAPRCPMVEDACRRGRAGAHRAGPPGRATCVACQRSGDVEAGNLDLRRHLPAPEIHPPAARRACPARSATRCCGSRTGEAVPAPQGRRVQAPHRHGPRGRRRDPRHPRRRDARSRRRVRVRQDHDAAADPRPRAADGAARSSCSATTSHR